MTEEQTTPEEQKSPEQLIEEMEQAQEPVSQTEVREAFIEETPSSGSGSSVVPIVAIVAGAVLAIGCIFACAAIAITFLINAPW